MGHEQYYTQVSVDEAASPLVGEAKSPIMRAPPSTTTKSKRTILTKAAIIALAVTAFIAGVALVSSAVVAYRLPAATEAAVQKLNATGNGAEPVKECNPSDSSSDETKAASEADDTSTDHSALYDHTVEMKDCGGNAEEARAKGCEYDVMMQLWTRPECIDKPLSERFLANGNWTWYADPAASRAYTDEEIRKGEHTVVYVAQSYHRHHCIFSWEKLVRAMRNQAPLIEELISYDHVMHCRHKTLTLPEEGAHDVRGVVAPTGFSRCASYDVWINQLPFNKMSSVD